MAAEKKPSPLTEYVILVALDRGAEHGRDAWRVLKTVSARSQDAAVKAAADPAGEATYVAVPARSFVPVVVTPNTVTTLELKAAS